MADFKFEFQSCDVDIVEDPRDRPVRITFRAADGQTVVVYLQPADGNRFGNKVLKASTEALVVWKPLS